MRTTIGWFIFAIIGLMGLTGCVYESLTYRTVTDGVDKKVYLVAGRVTDSCSRPIEHCRVYLSKNIGNMGPIFVGLTDGGGNYNVSFELDGATQFWLQFDARAQGYPLRCEDFSHLLESRLFQYTGNNPVILNVIMDKTQTVQQPHE
jgi:hypothetical protein